MSVTFTVKGKKNLLGEAEILTIGESLRLGGQNLSQYTFDADAIEGFYEAKVSRPECLLLGVEGKSMRGFEFSCDEDGNQYHVRVFTPSTIEDWEVAIAFMQALAEYFDAEIISEQGDIFSVDTIAQYNYMEDIRCGIRAMQGHEEYQVFGIYRPIGFNEEMIKAMLDSEEPARVFGEMTTFIQYLNAYSANQKFYRYANEDDEEEVIGSYTLTQDTDTILPYEPSVEFENIENINPDSVKYWQIVLVGIEGDPEDQDSYFVMENLPYEEFIDRLPAEKYRFIDGKYILVQACSREEMENLAEI